MALSDGLMILAVLLAPFFAVFAQRQVELWRARRERKLSVFKMLMATRGRVVSAEHVQALNMIELEFTDRGDGGVLTAWAVYRDHLNSFPPGAPPSEDAIQRWVDRGQDNLTALLGRMGKSLGYSLDPVQITKGVYAPQAHAAADIEFQLLRRALLDWLSGRGKVSVSVLPADEDAARKGQEFLSGVLSLVKGETRVKVEIAPSQQGKPDPQPSPPAPDRNVGSPTDA